MNRNNEAELMQRVEHLEDILKQIIHAYDKNKNIKSSITIAKWYLDDTGGLNE